MYDFLVYGFYINFEYKIKQFEGKNMYYYNDFCERYT